MKFLAQSLQIGGATPGASVNIQGPLNMDWLPSRALCKPNCPPLTLGDVVSGMIIFIMPLVAIIFTLIIIWGGLDFMFSQGDPAKVKSASAKLTAGLIGLVIIFCSFLIIKLIEYIFGVGQGII